MDEQNIKNLADQIVEKVKEIVKNGNAAHISLKRNGETLLSVSTYTGIIGAAIGLKAAPFAVLTAALVAYGLDCEIEIEKRDGTIVKLNETKVGSKLGNLRNSAKGKAKDLFGEGFEVSVTVEPDQDGTTAEPAEEAETEAETAE